MLFARSSIVTVAKAYSLKAVDLVCVQYKGEKAEETLRDESKEGRELGFDGKVSLHFFIPGQKSRILRELMPCSKRFIPLKSRQFKLLSHRPNQVSSWSPFPLQAEPFYWDS
jgi:hypothetical protein